MECDVLVIGSGPGGYRAAVLAALQGRKTVIVERATWGGCCLNRGCVPKKDWYHSARLLAQAARLEERGIAGTLVANLAQAWRHQHEVVKTVRESYQAYLKRLGVRALAGQATFTADRTVLVSPLGESVTAKAVIIATGSEPIVPPGLSIVSGRVIHSDLLFDEPVPSGKRVFLVGGGIVGLEFSYILSQLGCEVRWMTRRDPFARTDFSPPAMSLLRRGLADAGIVPFVGTLQGVSVTAAGVRIEIDQQPMEEADWVLLATGRQPTTRGLGLDTIGVRCDAKGFIIVDSTLQTEAPGVFALGDCVAGPMTANRALYEAGVVVDNILAPGARTRELARVPEAIYSALELARVGLTEDQVEDQGREPAVGFSAFETSPRALGQGEPEGYVRLIADLESGELLGGEVVGSEAGELIHLLASAPRLGGLRHIAATAFNHPSRSEEFQNAVETLAAKWKLGEHVFGPEAESGSPRPQP